MEIDVQQFKDEKTPNPKKSFFKKSFDDYTLDFLPELKASIKFHQAYKRREIVNLAGIDISYLSLNDLITDKEATSRPKDLRDIEELKSRNINE